MTKASWRDALQIHPLANVFPLLDDADLVSLGEDIKRNGLTSPIAIKIENGAPVLIDGRNRLDAMERVGLRVTIKKGRRGWNLTAEEQDDDLWDVVDLDLDNETVTVICGDTSEYIASVNIHRRHLTTESKRTLIAQLLKENPERSDRATAALVKVDGKTVAAVRRQEEDVRSIPHVEKRIDTKGRAQPANKQKATEAPLPKVPERIPPNEADVKAVNAVVPRPEAIGTIKQFAVFCRSNPPTVVASGVLPHEVTELQSDLALIEEWLSQFDLALAERGA